MGAENVWEESKIFVQIDSWFYTRLNWMVFLHFLDGTDLCLGGDMKVTYSNLFLLFVKTWQQIIVCNVFGGLFF